MSSPSLEESKRKREMLASKSVSYRKFGSIPLELNCPVWGSAPRLGQAAKKTRQCVIKGEEGGDKEGQEGLAQSGGPK